MALRFKFLFKEFCASLKLRTRRTSGFALRATQNPLSFHFCLSFLRKAFFKKGFFLSTKKARAKNPCFILYFIKLYAINVLNSLLNIEPPASSSTLISPVMKLKMPPRTLLIFCSNCK